MIQEIISNQINEFLSYNLVSLIEKTSATISISELKSFVLNHPRLPIIKKNLEKELNQAGVLKYDIESIKLLTKDMINMFCYAAIRYHQELGHEKTEV